MCGIVGLVSKQKKPGQKEIVKKMQAAIAHRGPDGDGLFESDQVILAMQRLAIIDVNGGNQPLYNENKDLVVVGNGEIYNYPELQENLNKKGHQFSSQSDIETLLHSYEDKGIGLLDDLVGMFAFALYDTKKEVLYIARDRYGEKPLYYTFTENGFVFSSELKSLLQAPGINKKLDFNAINDYFYYNYIPEPNTMFSAIKKIPAGSFIKLDIKSFKHTIERYSDFKSIKAEEESNPVTKIREGLIHACENCLRSDVPVGISLSGGIDSSAVLAICSQISKKNLTAFSIGYEEESSHDESQFAEKFAKQLGVKFIREKIGSDELINFFPELIYWSDDPIADIAAFGIYSVAKISKKNNVPVLLGGLGGDELFWGYPSFNQIVQGYSKQLPINNYNLYRKNRVYKRAKIIAPILLKKSFKTNLTPNSGNGEEIKDKVTLAKESLDQLRNSWLAGNCLALNDRLSMASSIEARVPFLDVNLTKTVLKSKENLLAYESLDPKSQLKKALHGILPEEVLQRPKRGFTPPVFQWFKKILSSYIYLLEDGFLVKEGIIDKNKIKILIPTWWAYSIFWDDIYKLILLEIWGREYCYNIKPENILKKS